MGKDKQSMSTLLRLWVKEVNRSAYTTDGKVVFCQACQKSIPVKKKFQLTQHTNTEVHQANEKLKRDVRQTLLPCAGGSQQSNLEQSEQESQHETNFSQDLCDAFVAADIPWYKATCPKFKGFLEKYTRLKVPDQSTLRKNYLPKCYAKTLESIRADIGENDIWVQADETVDKMGRQIGNVVVGKLDTNGPGNPYLIHSEELEKTNNATIARMVNDALGVLWPSGIKHSKVRLFVTDGAAYMKKAGSALKVFYPNLFHVTCLAHALHLTAECVRNAFQDVDKLIAMGKKVFLKAPSRVQAYKSACPDLPLPPKPVVTRWGTWLDAAKFYAENFECVKAVVDLFDPSTAECISSVQEAFASQTVRASLTHIVAYCIQIGEEITNLEEKGMPLLNAIEIVERLKYNLKNAPTGSVVQLAYKKLESVIVKNKVYETMKHISSCINQGTPIPVAIEEIDNLSPGQLSAFKYAPVTSVEVERSFSEYKSILRDNRMRMTAEHIKMLLVSHCNARYFAK